MEKIHHVEELVMSQMSEAPSWYLSMHWRAEPHTLKETEPTTYDERIK